MGSRNLGISSGRKAGKIVLETEPLQVGPKQGNAPEGYEAPTQKL